MDENFLDSNTVYLMRSKNQIKYHMSDYSVFVNTPTYDNY